MKDIGYPYLPAGRSFEYVPASDPFMMLAAEACRNSSTDLNHPTGSVVVLKGVVQGSAANQAAIRSPILVKAHKNLCVRKLLHVKTGTRYWLCPGCASPRSHSEPRAINDARRQGHDTEGADLYLWGHWWCCEPCWRAIIGAGIARVCLMEGSEETFR